MNWQAELFFESQKLSPKFAQNVEHMSNAVSVALCLKKESAVSSMLQLAGPSNPVVAKRSKPKSLHAIYGLDDVHNAFYCSQTLKEAKRNIDLVIGGFCKQNQSAFAWIKPKAVLHRDSIADAISQTGLRVAREDRLTLSVEHVVEFCKGNIEPDKLDTFIFSMTKGPTIALEIEGLQAVLKLKLVYESLSPYYGSDGLYVSPTPDSASRDIDVVFNKLALIDQYTFALIKPEAFEHRHAITTEFIDSGFKVYSYIRMQTKYNWQSF